MRRFVVFITGIFAVISVLVSSFFAYQYYGENNIAKERRKIKSIEKQIDAIKNHIEEKSKEKDEVISMNQEKVALLELWQKELAKLKK